MSTEVTNISTFIETLKNAGVVITGEETVLNHLAAAQCPQKALLDLAMQGRRVGVTFYQRGLGVDFDLAAKAFLELGNGENNESFRGFIANLRPNPAPEVPIATHYEA